MTNTQIVQQGYEAFGRGDVPGILALMNPDVEWTMPEMPNVPWSKTYHGHEGLQQFFATLAESTDIQDFQPKTFIAEGDRVVVQGTETARVPATEKTYRSNWVHVFTMKGEKVIGFRAYTDTAILNEAFA